MCAGQRGRGAGATLGVILAFRLRSLANALLSVAASSPQFARPEPWLAAGILQVTSRSNVQSGLRLVDHVRPQSTRIAPHPTPPYPIPHLLPGHSARTRR